MMKMKDLVTLWVATNKENKNVLILAEDKNDAEKLAYKYRKYAKDNIEGNFDVRRFSDEDQEIEFANTFLVTRERYKEVNYGWLPIVRLDLFRWEHILFKFKDGTVEIRNNYKLDEEEEEDLELEKVEKFFPIPDWDEAVRIEDQPNVGMDEIVIAYNDYGYVELLPQKEAYYGSLPIPKE